MARRSTNTTRTDIIRVGTRFFLESGYSHTSPKMICEELDLSTGNLTYYFPSKEHLLAELVQLLCRFQEIELERETEDGISSVMAICMEFAYIAAVCEDDEVAKDFFISTYSSPMCLELIRKNDTARAMVVFKDYRPDWTHEQFEEAEILVSGIEYATLMKTENSASLETRISGALNYIMMIYGIPEETRKLKIEKVLKMDYISIGNKIFNKFIEFAEDATEQAIESLLSVKRKVV